MDQFSSVNTPRPQGTPASEPFPLLSDVPRQSIDLGEIPIEIVTLSDSFVESLTAKVHPTPPSIDRLHVLFQEFYDLASSHISTHIATLATQQIRESSSAPTSTVPSLSRSFLGRRAPASAAPSTKRNAPEDSEQQMLSAEEMAAKQQARKAFEAKKMRLEEAVERRLCEGIYDRIYRHRSTQDQASDDRLRSRTAALALVGINPSDLGIALGEIAEDTPEAKIAHEEKIKAWLEDARKSLVRMHESHYPLGKLNHLRSAHRAIVETLARFHPSSSSADEILPMLIYTLITMPPEDLNVTSDMHFIQNFRWTQKLSGEAAYCLTNLEAAIGFLETVDLSTLRADERPSGPIKVPGSSSLTKSATFPPAYTSDFAASMEGTETDTAPSETSKSRTNSRSTSPSAATTSTTTTTMSGTILAGLSRPSKPRTLSELANAPAANAIGVASDILTTADQGLKNISTSLGDSYKFVLGKLREPNATGRSLVVPTTLEEARRLISTPPPEEETFSYGNSTDGHDVASPNAPRDTLHRPQPLECKMFDLMGGRKAVNRNAGSGAPSRNAAVKDSIPSSSGSNTAVLDSVLNLGSSLNPMARLSSISSFRGFGRSASGSQNPSSTIAPTSHPSASSGNANVSNVSAPLGSGGSDADVAPDEGGHPVSAFPGPTHILPPPELPRIAPPKKRFMELQNPGDIRVSEVIDLLRDYRRLAKALEERNAFIS
ncbi:hypothetical protein Cpir12675_004942 [Ceratocystis pirilliformis]|uniref:VPS9 domain-containing protein n=1 Tax=Ceratocystis pirilliformis TaxID=259994 RepID=A0ABR3YUF2_9PEZI